MATCKPRGAERRGVHYCLSTATCQLPPVHRPLHQFRKAIVSILALTLAPVPGGHHSILTPPCPLPNKTPIPGPLIPYFFPVFFSLVSFRTFFTIFCSSIKNALTIRSRTQFPHRLPPYALRTDFWDLEIVAYSLGRRAGIYERKD